MLSFGTWTRRRGATGSVVDAISLVFPDPSGGSNRTQVYVPASKPDDVSAYRLDKPLTLTTRVLRNLVTFDAGPDRTSVTLARDAGVFTLQSYNTAPKGSVSFAPRSSYAVEAATGGMRLTAVEQLQLALVNVSASYAVAAKTNFPDIDIIMTAASIVIGRVPASDFAQLRQRFPAMKLADLHKIIMSRANL